MGGRRERQRGQALVEFSLAIFVFVVMVMGIFDFGRGIYQFNGVSEASREIARATSVHPGSDFTTSTGQSNETKSAIAIQKGLVPSLSDPTFKCISASGLEKPSSSCVSGDSVRVTIFAPYSPITPLLGLVNKTSPPCAGEAFACLQSSSTVKIQ